MKNFQSIPDGTFLKLSSLQILSKAMLVSGRLHPWNLTWIPKLMVWNMYLRLQTWPMAMLGIYLRFQGSNVMNPSCMNLHLRCPWQVLRPRFAKGLETFRRPRKSQHGQLLKWGGLVTWICDCLVLGKKWKHFPKLGGLNYRDESHGTSRIRKKITN